MSDFISSDGSSPTSKKDVKIIDEKFEPLKLVESKEIDASVFQDLPSTQLDLLPNAPDFGENFKVLDFIGEGGMGKVWKVKDLSLDEEFAFKVLTPELINDKTFLKMFLNESKLAVELDHPNIAAVYRADRTLDGDPYIAMQLVEGLSLAELLKRENALDEIRSLNIFEQIVSAVNYSHSKGIVHCDLKPSNIIIARDDHGEEKAYIIDYGISKSVFDLVRFSDSQTRSLTKTGLGSPSYMSPEHLLGSEVDISIDYYSIGCILFEMVRGRPPFEDPNPGRLIIKHLNETPDLAGLSTNLKNILAACLQKDPSSRKAMFDFYANGQNSFVAKTLQLDKVKAFNGVLFFIASFPSLMMIWTCGMGNVQLDDIAIMVSVPYLAMSVALVILNKLENTHSKLLSAAAVASFWAFLSSALENIILQQFTPPTIMLGIGIGTLGLVAISLLFLSGVMESVSANLQKRQFVDDFNFWSKKLWLIRLPFPIYYFILTIALHRSPLEFTLRLTSIVLTLAILFSSQLLIEFMFLPAKKEMSLKATTLLALRNSLLILLLGVLSAVSLTYAR